MNESAAFRPPTQEQVGWDITGLFRGAIQLVLEYVLEQEVREMIGARRYERLGSRKDHLNGTYLRRLLTSLGLIEVAVPRTRHSGSPVEVIGRYQRRTSDVDQMVTEAYVQGVSTRGMGQVTQALMGEEVARSTVSRVTKVLDERVEQLRRAPIKKKIPYLYLDATFLDARWARSVENVSALVAYGVDENGHRRLLGISIGPQESQDSWTELIRQLLDRGLSGVELVIADEHRGLASAVRLLLPDAKRQRCTVHLQRNILTKVPQRLRKRVAGEVRKVVQAPSRRQAKRQLQLFAEGLGRQLPEALKCFQEGFNAATAFYDFPSRHWVRIRSTNGLERLHGEIKRRIRSVGAFPDRESALRLITAVALQVTQVWGARRYLHMSPPTLTSRSSRRAA